MNRVYKVIWSYTNRCWIAVSELGKTKTRSKSSIQAITLSVILSSQSVSGAEISCSYSNCSADGNITIATNKNLNEEVGNKYPSMKYTATLGVGVKDNSTINIVNGGNLTSGLITVGKEKEGIINIFDGGKVTIERAPQSNNNYSNPLTIGDGARGEINIDGSGSELTYKYGNEVNIGNNSLGVLNITNGGSFSDLSTSTNFYVGGRGAAEGIINVNGQGSTLNLNSAIIGTWGQGSLNITNGGVVNFQYGASVGYNNKGNIVVSGNGSELNLASKLYITRTNDINSQGKVIVKNDGKISARSISLGNRDNYGINSTGAAELIIGSQRNEAASAAGTLDVDEILLGGANSSLILNHTNEQYTLNTNIKSSFGAENEKIDAINGTTTLNGDNSKFVGSLNISKPATIKINNQQNIGKTSINNDGHLHITTNNDWVFNNSIIGNGVITAQTNQNTFSFQDSALTAGFTGKLELLNTRFDLTGTNTNALATAGLTAGSDSLVTVGAGNQSIAQLAFAGGTLNFGHVLPGQTQADNRITVDKTLDLTGNGIVQVDNSGVIDNTNQNINHNLSLLEQDDTNASIKLVTLGQNAPLSGNAGNLQLHDMAGQSISNDVQHSVQQDGQNVAHATYDYRLTTGENQDGLYVGYGLTQLELLGSNDAALTLDASGKSGNAADLSAKITGTGDLRISGQPNSILSLSNRDNDYTGTTYLDGGTLLMQNDHVLGNTDALRLLDNTTLDMNGHRQTVGTLTALTGATVNLNGGTLTIENGGGVEEGGLTGQGAININGGVFGTLGANNALSATVTLAQGARALLNNTLGLGVGNLVNNGMVTLHQAAGALYNNLSGNGAIELNDNSDITLAGNNHAFSGTFDIDEQSALTASAAQQLGTAQVNNRGSLTLNAQHDWSLDNRITGTGSVTKQGAGALHITNNADWTGETHIQQGNMMLGTTDAPVTLNSSHINIAQQGILSGFGGTTGDISNSGTLFVGAPANNARMPIMPATFTVGGTLTNSGTIVLGQPGRSAGNQLIVNGDYTGNNGHLLLNSVLHDDASTTDKLIVQGNTAGHTQVHITNAGGTGAQTLNGIEVIHVQGQSDGEFSANRIVAGAYDYTLARGQGAQSNNWYLTSGKQEVPPVPTPEPVPNHDNDLRPEGGSYTANLVAANTLFQLRLQDRNGSAAYMRSTGEEPQNTNMWIKHVGGQNRWRDSSGQLKTRSNRYSLQLGGDVARWTTGESGAVRLGAMAGYGNVSSHTRSSRTGYRAEGNINGYSTGLYATWYANDETREGAYLDSWAQYNWFNNTVKGDELQSESYRSKGVTASLEAGITHKVKSLDNGDGTKRDWYIQPQAQVVLMDVHADTHQEHNGTRVTADESANVQTRLGVKTWLKQTHTLKSGQTGEILPYAEVNWLHNRHDFGTRLDGVAVHQSGARDIGEVKVGVEGQVNSRMNVWGNVSVQAGNNGYSDTAAMLGVQWRF